MQEFLASLTPAMREQVQAALKNPEARSRLQLMASKYVIDGEWPTGTTADLLARQFLREQGRWDEVTYAGSGLGDATLAGLAGGAITLAASKGAVVLSSKILAAYWQDVVAYELGLHPLVVSTMKKAFDHYAQGTRWEQLSRDLTAPSGPTDAQVLFGDGLSQIIQREMTGVLKKAAWQGSRSAVHHLSGTVGDYSAENHWVESYVSRLARNQGDLAVRTLRWVVNDSLEQGHGIRYMADRLSHLWNLSPQHAQAVSRYRRRLDEDLPSGKARDLAWRYAGRLHNHRLKTLTDTEIAIAFNAGREARWQQAVQRGEMPLGTRKMWVTAMDELVCPVCKPLDGQSVPLGESFVSSIVVMIPAAHPNCRCIIVPVMPTADISRERLVFPSQSERASVAKHLGGSSGKEDHPSGTPQSVHGGVENLMESITSVRSGKFSLRPSKVIGGKKTPGMQRHGDSWSVMLEVMHEDHKDSVGAISFTLRDDKSAYLDWFTLDSKHQAGGFGREIFDVGMKALKEAGVKKAKMEANIDVGGYAWAVMGFDFDPDPEIGKPGLQDKSLQRRVNYFKEHGYAYFGVLGRASNWYGRKRGIKTSAYTDQQREDINRRLDDLLERSEKYPVGHSKAPTAQEIAVLGREYRWKHERGFSLWPGKEILLGSVWDGVMDLDQVAKAVSQWDRVLAWMEDAEFVDASDLAREDSDYNLHARVVTATPESEDRLWDEVSKKLVHVDEYRRSDGISVKEHFRQIGESDEPLWDAAARILSRGQATDRSELVKEMRSRNLDASKPLRRMRNGRIVDFSVADLGLMTEGYGFRLGNENHIRRFANSMIEGRDVFTFRGRRDPIMVLVYSDGAQVLDGKHRLAAASLIGRETVPIQIARVRKPMPEPQGLRQEWDELRRQVVRYQHLHREVPSPRTTTFRTREPLKGERVFNEWMQVRSALRDEERFLELGVTRGKRPSIFEQFGISKKQVKVKAHQRGGRTVREHLRDIKEGVGDEDLSGIEAVFASIGVAALGVAVAKLGGGRILNQAVKMREVKQVQRVAQKEEMARRIAAQPRIRVDFDNWTFRMDRELHLGNAQPRIPDQMQVQSLVQRFMSETRSMSLGGRFVDPMFGVKPGWAKITRQKPVNAVALREAVEQHAKLGDEVNTLERYRRISKGIDANEEYELLGAVAAKYTSEFKYVDEAREYMQKAGPASRSDFDRLFGAIGMSPQVSKPLHRGVVIDTNSAKGLKWTSKGESFELPVSSFTDDFDSALGYAGGGSSQLRASVTGEKVTGTPVVFRVNNAHALEVGDFAHPTQALSQREWVTSGRFVVDDVTELDDGVIIVDLFQEAVVDMQSVLRGFGKQAPAWMTRTR